MYWEILYYENDKMHTAVAFSQDSMEELLACKEYRIIRILRFENGRLVAGVV